MPTRPEHRPTSTCPLGARALTGAVLIASAVFGTSACATAETPLPATTSAAIPAPATPATDATDATGWSTVTDPTTGVSVRLAGTDVSGSEAGGQHKYVVQLSEQGEQRLNLGADALELHRQAADSLRVP